MADDRPLEYEDFLREVAPPEPVLLISAILLSGGRWQGTLVDCKDTATGLWRCMDRHPTAHLAFLCATRELTRRPRHPDGRLF